MSQLPKDDKKRVTIYNVANEAGVSLATVSRVINNSDVVREDTRKKVQDAIIKLGYKPNAVAQGLALKKTTTIALIVPDSSFYYIGKFINGLLDVAKIYKYNITLHTVSAGVNEMNEIVDNVIKSHADGIVIFNEIFSQQDLETINSYQIPMVYLDSKAIGENSCAVYIDYKKAAYEVVNDYLARGISDIAVIDDRKNPLNVSQIVEGVSEAFNEHDMEFNNLVSTPEINQN